MRLRPLIAFAAVAALLVAAGSPAALAGGRKSYEDRQRGFRVQLDEKFVQVPPKLTADEAYVVGDWYMDSAKFDSGFQRPEFKIWWFATPKASTITPGSKDKPAEPPAGPETQEEMIRRMREGQRAKSVDEAIDSFFGLRGSYFGGEVAKAADIWKTADKAGTRTPKLDVRYAEINDPDDKKNAKKSKGRDSTAFAVIAKLELDRPGETIEVGFLGYCGMGFVKDGKKNFLDIVKSFEDLAKIATDSRNLGAQTELDANDPEAFRKSVHRQKLIKGWAAHDTPHYVVLYPDKDVDVALVKTIGTQIESLRTQVYEVMFPADRPIKAISVIRVCKDRDQYFAYGGPPGSAGYWASGEMELVFYNDAGRKGDSLRVLYHEGFHQYIFYSVGDMSPHSWFNEGNGDYFFGFNYVGGKWSRDSNTWRKDLAKKAKREHKFPALMDWLRWTQREYYGGNRLGVSIGDNYALGWNFIYFLRTTKKKEYQGILDRYFTTLKGYVTRAREAREARSKAGDLPLPPEAGGEPPAPPPAPPGPPEEPPVPPPGPPDAPPPDGGTPPAPPADGGTPPVPPGPDGTPPVPPDAPPPPTPAPPTDPVKPPDAPVPPTPPDPVKPPEPQKPADPPPATPPTAQDPFKLDPELYDPRIWLDKALEEAFRGVDMRQLEKDWLDS